MPRSATPWRGAAMMARIQPSPRSTFWRQGAWTLLPVVLLAGMGLSLLRLDRRVAEQEARQRAEELARQMAAAVARPVAGEELRVSP